MEPEEFKVDPQQLRAEAEKEPRRRGLTDYIETIRVLKEEKDFSLREIAAWLQQRGLKVDHNAVWRAYSNTSSRSNAGAGGSSARPPETHLAHGGAMPWLEET